MAPNDGDGDRSSPRRRSSERIDATPVALKTKPSGHRRNRSLANAGAQLDALVTTFRKDSDSSSGARQSEDAVLQRVDSSVSHGSYRAADVPADNYGGPTQKKSVIGKIIEKREGEEAEAPSRIAELNASDVNEKKGYFSNVVRTTKYTWWNFVPKSLFEQFRRVFNVYYVFVVIISFIPGVSPVAPAVNLVPLVIILGFGIARELYEDVKRALNDKRLNNSVYHIVPRLTSENRDQPLSRTELEKVKCRDLEVGDVVYLQKGDLIPADLLILSCSDAGGQCYVSTANLDGETNLKLLQVVSAETNAARKPEDIMRMRGKVQAQAPDPALYHFEARFETGETAVPLDSSNLALRGSRLRNTAHLYGLVTYAGYDTKEALNMRIPPYKFGEVEKLLNVIVIFLCVSLLVICLAYGTAATIIQSGLSGVWYLGQGYTDDFGFGENVSAGTWFKSLASFLILYASYVPVSLFVTLELCRVVQTLYIQFDVLMASRGRNAASTASNLNETLAEIDYICTDKTGTLTENIMTFVACSINKKVVDLRKTPNGLDPPSEQGETRSADDVNNMKDLILAMALCHNVVPEPPDDEDGVVLSMEPDDLQQVKASTNSQVGKIAYQGPSPDEVALVDAARNCGVELVSRTQDAVIVTVYGQLKEYPLLAELEFNSDRKRMSTIVRDPDDNSLWIYTKGADNIMLGLVSHDESQTEVLRVANEHVDFFAKEGLRTLVYARRKLTEEEFEAWKVKFTEAKASLENREQLVDEVQAEIEQNLLFISITAVEDRLQADLSPTIAFLRGAGIKIWVLTGDKRQTAESIGYSSALLDASSMRVLHIEAHSSDEAQHIVRGALEEVAGDQLGEILAKYSQDKPNGWLKRKFRSVKDKLLSSRKAAREILKEQSRSSSLAIIVDGVSLQFLIDDHADLFMDLCDFCKTVICCRVTPRQKALVVRMVQALRKKITLAIGDGANDVSMIQEAQIGVGIYGKEGMNAARAADFSMSEFRFLKRLLMVHGHYAYVRTAKMINLQFYKNLLFVCAQFFFQYVCLFSGRTLHNQWYVSTFNVVITSIPPFIIGILERDLKPSTLMNYPKLYREYRLHPLVGLKSVLEYTLGYATFQAIIIFVFAVFTNPNGEVYPNGQLGGLEIFGFMITTVTCLVTLGKFMMVAHWWNWIFLLSIAISIMFFLCVPPFAIAIFDEQPLVGIMAQSFTSATFWLYLILATTVAMMPDFVMYMIRMIFRPPKLVDIHQAAELKGDGCFLPDFE
eukprot:CAMPEP_0185847072 /NCGR_PEP_ID=MMETSP1354-20130828/2479_1 /TAXON_ID=708628 /ORGANISM="Erythrolobus madagascarensis, Strain CCMP3276" /LENGTH=1256 /DNA_ID=CAMNT_0028547321 /DNA_START=36 /DNA_END=3806 /DNA_ORIENTATION=-